jgi:hypothetical protein
MSEDVDLCGAGALENPRDEVLQLGCARLDLGQAAESLPVGGRGLGRRPVGEREDAVALVGEQRPEGLPVRALVAERAVHQDDRIGMGSRGLAGPVVGAGCIGAEADSGQDGRYRERVRNRQRPVGLLRRDR